MRLHSLYQPWIGSVQGAVATWSVIRCASHGWTRSLPLPVLTRSKCDSASPKRAQFRRREVRDGVELKYLQTPISQSQGRIGRVI